jgi:ribonuclease P protein component
MRRYASMRRHVEFVRLRERGRRVSSGAFTAYRAHPQPGDRTSVVGITVGKPVGKAVVRNKVRRRIAAILREELKGRKIRVLIVARPIAATTTFAELRNALEEALV